MNTVSVNTILDRLAHIVSSITSNKSLQGRDLSKTRYRELSR